MNSNPCTALPLN